MSQPSCEWCIYFENFSEPIRLICKKLKILYEASLERSKKRCKKFTSIEIIFITAPKQKKRLTFAKFVKVITNNVSKWITINYKCYMHDHKQAVTYKNLCYIQQVYRKSLTWGLCCFHLCNSSLWETFVCGWYQDIKSIINITNAKS